MHDRTVSLFVKGQLLVEMSLRDGAKKAERSFPFRFMLPKKRRLTKKLLDEVMLYGKIFHSPVLSLKAIKVMVVNDVVDETKKDTDKSHFSAVAAKKYFKTAVMRNKVRRRTYAALTDVISCMDRNSLNVNGNIFHCVLMLKPTILDIDQSALKQAIHEIFVKSRIIT